MRARGLEPLSEGIELELVRRDALRRGRDARRHGVEVLGEVLHVSGQIADVVLVLIDARRIAGAVLQARDLSRERVDRLSELDDEGAGSCVRLLQLRAQGRELALPPGESGGRGRDRLGERVESLREHVDLSRDRVDP